ncbi:MAG: GrpB family protein [Planctomycetota bacterium]|nr:GrpB family protein [Planctomycetota bacterium]
MIAIHDPKENWPDDFREIALEIRRRLGDRALRIDHIGSTSVLGLASKDRIDLQITVAGFEGFASLVELMEQGSFLYRESNQRDHRPPGDESPDWNWEKRYFSYGPNKRPANIHVRAEGRANQRYALLFRDYLRAHRDMALAYEAAKRQLAKHFDDTGVYSDVKDPICDLIIGAAKEWADRSNWTLGSSDV